MTDECPHCLRKVLLKADGTCPACGKNSNDTHGVDPTRCLLVVAAGAKLPGMCFNCTQPAKDFAVHTVTGDSTSGTEKIAHFVACLFVPYYRLFTRLDRASRNPAVTVRLPVCAECRRLGIKPKVDSTDLEERSFRFLVHKTFATAFRTLNARPDITHS